MTLDFSFLYTTTTFIKITNARNLEVFSWQTTSHISDIKLFDMDLKILAETLSSI